MHGSQVESALPIGPIELDSPGVTTSYLSEITVGKSTFKMFLPACKALLLSYQHFKDNIKRQQNPETLKNINASWAHQETSSEL